MHLQTFPPSSQEDRSHARDFGRASDATWIFGHAIHDCKDLLDLREQTVTIGNAALHGVASLQNERLANLVALAIGDIASVSRRGGDLSLGAVGNAIVIQSTHPLEIPGDRLEIDDSLRDAASALDIAIALAWDAGRGPRLTLSLPLAVVPRAALRWM